MKNALLFYYNIEISNNNLNKINENYYFSYQNSDFIVARYSRNIDDVNELYYLTEEMINNNIPLYKIITTKENNILFSYEGIYYILMIMPKIKNRLINYNDVINFNYIPTNNNKKYKAIDKSYWTTFWSNKIDYIEYQFFQLEKKYSIIKKSINFYIGIWENAISYYNNNVIYDNFSKCVCHKRLTSKTDLLSFLNPLNLVIDYKERDVAEYIKSFVYEEKFTEENIEYFLKAIPINENIIIRFISRVLFPSNYFDLYEEIIYENAPESKIEKIIENKKNYLFLMKLVFKYFETYNIPTIEWIEIEKTK